MRRHYFGKRFLSYSLKVVQRFGFYRVLFKVLANGALISLCINRLFLIMYEDMKERVLEENSLFFLILSSFSIIILLVIEFDQFVESSVSIVFKFIIVSRCTLKDRRCKNFEHRRWKGKICFKDHVTHVTRLSFKPFRHHRQFQFLFDLYYPHQACWLFKRAQRW